MKKVLRVLGILLVLALVAHQVWTYVARREFEQRAEGVERLADFKQPPVPEEQDVVAGLLALEQWIEKHDKEFGHSVHEFDIDGWEDLEEEQLALRRRYLKSVGSVFPRLEEVLRRPHYRTTVDWGAIDVFPREIVACQVITRTIMVTARLAESEDDIVRVARLLLRFAERLEMPFVLGYAVGTVPRELAVDAIRINRLRPKLDVASLRRELDGPLEAAYSAARPSARALRQERASCLAVTEVWSRGRSLEFTPADGKQRAWLRRPQLYHDAVRYLDLFDKGIKDCETTSADQALAVSKRYAGGPLEGAWWLTDSAGNMIRYHFRLFAADVARLRLARVALALMQVRQETGEWPGETTGPKLIDPFSGKQFRYEVGDDEVRLYAAKEVKGPPEQAWESLEDDALAWSWPK